MSEETNTGVAEAPNGDDKSLAMPAVETTAPEADTTEADLEAEFGQVETPATVKEGDDDKAVDPAKESGEGDEPKPKPEVQTRIDELTAGRREAERREAEARRDVEYWKGQAEKLAPPPKGTTEDPDQAPNPENYEFGEADAKFIAETARFHARQEFQSQQEAATVRAELATLETNWQGNSAKVVERYPDFNEKVVASADRQEWDCSPLMAIGIKSSEHGPDIAYHLATNPAESKRIASMTNIEQAREFGKLEARFEYEAKGRQAPPQPKTSAAPPPPSGQVRGAGGRFAVDADTSDFAAFEKSADALLKK